ncbi:MAG: hypothetical protein Q7J98_11470 [Kiritimatiellia bacterium]|nr:hypothetical protein [Kiritimatiellia bacterium]
MNGSENEIRRLFHELRARDEQRVPSFSRLCRAPAVCQTVPVRHGFSFRLAAAAMLLVMGVGIAIYCCLPSRLQGIKKMDLVSINISEWQAPTDFLLRSPWEELLKNAPSLALLSGLTIGADAQN